MNVKQPLLIFALIVVLASCQSQPKAAPAFAPTGDPTFTLDFSNAPDWCGPYSESFGDFYCQAGEFHVVNKPASVIANMADGNFKDFMLEAQMRSAGEAGSYGVSFRGNNQTASFYIFRLSPAGDFELITWSGDEGEHILLPWAHSAAIHKGQAQNTLQVTARGNQITLFANGEQLATVQNDALSQGVVGATAMEGAHAVCSSLKVWELQ